MARARVSLRRWNIKSETDLFLGFLNHKDFPQNRNKILAAHPDLKNKLGIYSEKKAVPLYLSELNDFYKKEFNEVLKEAARDFKKTPFLLKILGEMMDYKWPTQKTYFASPTFLPFSPFRKNDFFFSVLGTIRLGERKNFNLTAVHEISHFILFDILQKLNICLPPAALHYLKEALTAALFNMPVMKKALKARRYEGNPEIRPIRMVDGSKTIILKDWIRREYIKNRRSKKSFDEFVILIGNNFIINKAVWEQKRKFWNRHGGNILIDKRLKLIYEKSVKF